MIHLNVTNCFEVKLLFITRRTLRKLLLIICITIILLAPVISGFYPVYFCRDNTITVNNIQYTEDRLADWRPTGETYKIGNLCGDVPLTAFLCGYKGDDEQLFVHAYTFPSNEIRTPYHRTDIPLPSFSADIIDSVSLGIGPEMTRTLMYDTEITASGSQTIAEIADCLSHPVQKDASKAVTGTTMRFSAKSSKYEFMTYELDVAIYDGKYCLIKKDGSLYEIPHQLLENIFDFEILTPEQYIDQEEMKIKLTFGKWRCVDENRTFYLFMQTYDYLIIEVKDNKPLLKESGLYKLDRDTLSLYPGGKQLNAYSLAVDRDDMQINPLTSTGFCGSWEYDGANPAYVEYHDGSSYIGQVAYDYFDEMARSGF